jgi:hypothetical protein
MVTRAFFPINKEGNIPRDLEVLKITYVQPRYDPFQGQ